jgi:timeless
MTAANPAKARNNATSSTKPSSSTTAKPNGANKQPSVLSLLDKAMTVDKSIVDELLLVCGVIGTTDDNESIVPVTDCLNWLQDLQRALRRDDDSYRPVSLLLGQWNVVQQKLLPLALSCRYDSSLVLTICKILVILTKPLAENTKRAGKVIINVKKADEL